MEFPEQREIQCLPTGYVFLRRKKVQPRCTRISVIYVVAEAYGGVYMSTASM